MVPFYVVMILCKLINICFTAMKIGKQAVSLCSALD